MKKTCQIFLLLIIFVNTRAQTTTYFNKTFGLPSYNQEVSACSSLESEYYLISLTSVSQDDYKLNFIKIDSVGDLVFEKTYSIPGYDLLVYNLSSMIYNPSDSSFVVPCTISSQLVNTDKKGYLMKFDLNGDTLWTRTFNNLNDSLLTFNGGALLDDGYILYGVSSQSDFYGDEILIKTDFNGNEIWRKLFPNTTRNAGFFSFEKTFDKGFILGGCTQWESGVNYGNWDFVFIKTDSLGVVEWQKYYGTIYDETDPPYVLQTMDSNYVYSSGYAEKEVWGPHGANFSKTCLTKLDQSGNVMWQKKYGDTAFLNSFHQIKELGNGDILGIGQYVTPYSYLPSGTFVSYVFKANYLGDSLFYRGFSADTNTRDNILSDFSIKNNMEIFAAGVSAVLIGSNWELKNWVIKLDSLGCNSPSCLSIGVSELEETVQKLKVYPNPFSNLINIDLSDNHIRHILIYNVLGEVVYSRSFTNTASHMLDLSDKENGIYFIKIFSDNEKLFVTKIIKSN